MNAPKFKPGDLIYLNPSNPEYHYLIGYQAKIISCEGEFIYLDNKLEYGYLISPDPCKYENDLEWAESALRLIPPKQQTTTWESCVWRPEGVTS